MQFDGLSPYTANLCPLSVWVELACFREDFGESIGELVETMLRSAVRKRTTEHLDGMLSEQQGIDDTVQTAARRGVRSFRLRRKMLACCFCAAFCTNSPGARRSLIWPHLIRREDIP